MRDTGTIAIIGGGFAGTTVARTLDGKLPAEPQPAAPAPPSQPAMLSHV